MTEPDSTRNRVGVCVVRAERESAWLLFTVSTTPDLANDATTRQVFREPEAVLAALADFLRSFSG